MILQPDLEFLERIEILTRFDKYLKNGGPQMEVEESDFKSLEPFLKRWGGGEALQELFFYQVNFVPICQPPKPQSLALIQKDITYFQSREKLDKMDFSQLQKIRLFGEDTSGNVLNADLPPDLVFYFGQWIKKELESEKPAETTSAERIKELKALEDFFKTCKLEIRKAIPKVEAILTGKNKDTIFDAKQSILITYALFYQRGHRLYFRTKLEPREDDPTLDLFSKDKGINVYDILKK